VDEKSYNNCKSCSAKMDAMFKKDKHHCRLCGQMFCSQCTQKYHVPLIFRIKNKDGPARVCFSCVDGCMKEKAAAEAKASSSVDPLSMSKLTLSSLEQSSTLPASLQAMAGKAVEIAPPAEWQEESAFQSCPKCRVSKVTSYNCRVCGLRYCDKCTSKMDVPPCFERKAKSGPSRVCDPCRYKVVQGAKLVEKLSGMAGATSRLQNNNVPPPPPGSKAGSTLAVPGGAAGASGGGRRMSSIARGCSAIGCAALATNGPEGKCAAHGGTTSASGGSGPAARETRLSIKRESDGSVLAELVLPNGPHGGPETSLSAIDVLFKKTAPQAEAYSYVFRGAPIPDAFFGVFFARHLGSTVFIGPRVGKGGKAGTKGAASASAAPVLVTSEDGVSTVNNPFKRDEAKEEAVLASRAGPNALKPKKEPIAVVEFKRPPPEANHVVAIKAAASSAPLSNGAGASVGGKKLPLPPPGSTGALAGGGAAAALAANGGDVDAVLKQRAKMLFN
jgi:hypothetical protein